MSTEAVTVSEAELLEMFAGFMNENVRRSINLYGDVVRDGRFYVPRPLGDDYPLGLPRYCYDNALEAAVEYGLPYVEGYATSGSMPGLPIHHAWVVDGDHVVDVTWPTVGLAYRGIEFDVEHVASAREAEMTALMFR